MDKRSVEPWFMAGVLAEIVRSRLHASMPGADDERRIPVFERFTDRARRAVTLAQDNARTLGHIVIGTEHLLLGLMQEGGGVACQALGTLGVTNGEVRDVVVRLVGAGDAAPEGHIPFTPRARKVLELALREALQLGHGYIGTEHLLLALIREGEGVAARILTERGFDLNDVRQEVIKILSGYAGQSGSKAAPQPPTPEPNPWLAKATAAYDAGKFTEAAAAAVIGLLTTADGVERQ